MTERNKITGRDGPPPFVPFNETARKGPHSGRPGEHTKSSAGVTRPLQKHSNQPKQDVKMPIRQMDRPQPYHHKTYETASHKQAGGKPHQYHQTKSTHQHDRLQDRPFQVQPSKQRTHRVDQQHRRSKGHSNDRSQGQSMSDVLPVTFDSSEQHFPALTRPTPHPQHYTTTADDKHQPPHRPMLAWDGQASNMTTGGSIPFSAKRKM